MIPLKTKMLTTTVIPVAVALGVGVSGMVMTGTYSQIGPAYAQCNPCAAKSPCNPCAAKACNPCAAKNPCNPCAAKACNPCAAKNPCNPCAAAACNPCNPCAGAKAGKSGCIVPRLAKAGACNPCAAKNPCNPCAAANACNPCAAKNPCNPCAAKNPCNPCNPCAAGGGAELSNAEAAKAYDCVINKMRTAYGKSGNAVAAGYQGWQRYSKVSFQSATHGGRYVQNYANAKGRAYGAFEKSGTMPAGAILAKDSFAVSGTGHVAPGPLFVMEKMRAGFNPDGGDWKYTMIMPNGSVFGETKGKNSAGMQFCIECHIAVGADQDSMFFLPEEFRIR